MAKFCAAMWMAFTPQLTKLPPPDRIVQDGLSKVIEEKNEGTTFAIPSGLTAYAEARLSQRATVETACNIFSAACAFSAACTAAHNARWDENRIDELQL
ncbi:hypothetical protein [Paracoccus jeotgali]|uniref:hypothetical protein n=1 Tax=Paracoccus jeotgali TaxID=2065379 RepID=UPI0028A66F36|nr:hypothetical protein [Paracoccus jeotgali]